MTDTLPRLAKPGEIRGFAIPGGLGEAYKAAAALALDHPEHPVVVEQFGYGTDDTEVQRRAAQDITKVQMAAVNKADHEDGAPAEVERYHVGYAKNTDAAAYLTFVVFYPDGRPVRARAAGAADEAGGEPAEQEEPEVTPRRVSDSPQA